MALTNHDRVGKAMALLKEGLGPFVEREMKRALRARRVGEEALRPFLDDPQIRDRTLDQWDVAAQLKLMWEMWNHVFRDTLGPAERGYVGELRGHRNRWAHQEAFSSDNAYRALDTAGRLLAAVSAPQAVDVDKIKMELLRVRFDEQARGERRRQASLAINTAATALEPWRSVVKPHPDVAAGNYQQAEFAADLWQVHLGEGSPEYADPPEFFRRTYLTESLKRLLSSATRRLSGEGGDPVVQLQTNFGGGKTHSMLALYHLCSGVRLTDLPGVEDLLHESEAPAPPDQVRRAVLVGNRVSPGNPVTKDDGTVVRTLWGELAWQLGGAEAFARIADDDARATNPGDALRELFIEFGPSLVLIDEWVAYARQLHDGSDLPAGSFETQFTFAQALTESAKLAGNCLLVVSLPASDRGEHGVSTDADDVEVGGQRGREALDRLRNVLGRIESSWRPATAEESFEIVRRRLFETLTRQDQFKHRDVTVRGFAEFYRKEQNEFPPECRNPDYEKRLKDAYPIHPEIFDRLYTDWSTLVTFQRTRGVLRLMASVIHNLWQRGHKGPMIMPADLALDDSRVQAEVTRYLPENWVPIIDADVDGPESLPMRTDGQVPAMGELSACRRVARTVYLGSAPTAGAAQRGIEDRRIRLGCALPGEPLSTFGDALRRLAAEATYLYQDGNRYWYSTQPTVTKLAEERAEGFRRQSHLVAAEIEGQLRSAFRGKESFGRTHVAPQSGDDVPDERDARLVVLGTEHAYHRDGESPAHQAAEAVLNWRGNAPRQYQNTLVFLVPDQSRLQDLEQGVREQLAWQSIFDDREDLELTPQQVRQTEAQCKSAAETVNARVPETYRWLITPVQEYPDQKKGKSRAATTDPTAPVTLDVAQISGSGESTLAERVTRWLRNNEQLLTSLAGPMLRLDLDKIPLWRGDHVEVKQLIEDFAKYIYLPRLLNADVLLDAISDGCSRLTWATETFAHADAYDEDGKRYVGLQAGQQVRTSDTAGVVVKADVAARQLQKEELAVPPGLPEPSTPGEPGFEGTTEPEAPPAATKPTRFHGSVRLNTTRAGRDASMITEEVITHLSGLVGANVTVTLEIEAEMPDGAPEHVVRAVTENSRNLNFDSHGFEED